MRTPLHEKWFIDASQFSPDWSFVFRPLTLLVITALIAVTIGWRRVATHVLPTPELPFLKFFGRLAPFLPRLLAIHLGVSLLALAVQGRFLAHDLMIQKMWASPVVALLEGALGVWFITGVRLRGAAVALIAMGPWALTATGPTSLMEGADLLGVAAFLAILPPSDSTFGAVALEEKRTKYALLALRLGVGVALISLAFTEKLANPSLAKATLAAYPQLNVFSLVGLNVPTETFVLIAGATELLFGLLVLSGAMPQIAVLVAGIPFNLTLLLFGATEMTGHLPVYGVFLVLLSYGSHPITAPWVRWLPSPGQARDGELVTAR